MGVQLLQVTGEKMGVPLDSKINPITIRKVIKNIAVSEGAFLPAFRGILNNLGVETSQEQIHVGSSTTIAGTVFSSGETAGTGAVTSHEMLTWNPFHVKIEPVNAFLGKFEGAIQVVELNKFVKKSKKSDVNMADLEVKGAVQWNTKLWVMLLAMLIGAFFFVIGAFILPFIVWYYGKKTAEKATPTVVQILEQSIKDFEKKVQEDSSELVDR